MSNTVRITSGRAIAVALCACGIGLAAFGAPKAETGATFGEAVLFSKPGIRAMALDIDGKHLYAGAGDKFFVYDLSNPLRPKKLGETSGLGGARQIAVQNGFAYVTTREYGLWIIDATDPKAPRVRSRFDTCELATGVDIAGDVCFCGQRQNGVEFIDVSDPDHPRHIAMRKTGESQSVKYKDGWLYSGEWGGGHVTVFDAHDMKAIREVKLVDLYGYGDGVWLQGNWLFAARGHHAKHRDVKGGVMTEEMKTYGGPAVGGGMGHGLDIFDVSDPANPKKTGFVDYPPFYARGLDMWTPRTSGNLLVASQTHNGLFAVDISDKSAPKVLDRWTCPDERHAEHPSFCIGSVAIGDGVVYAAANGGGFYAIPCKGAKYEKFERGVLPKNASYRESYPTDGKAWHVWKPKDVGQCRAVAVKGDVVYAACGDAGLYALQVLPNNGGLKTIGKLPGHEQVYDVTVDGDTVYTAEGLDGFGIYDVSAAPATFAEKARIPRAADWKSLALNVWKPADGWLVCSDRHGIDFFDIKNPAKAKHALYVGGAPGWDRYLADRAVGDGRYVAYNAANTAVKWIDLKAGKRPALATVTKKNRLSLSCGMCAFDGDSKVIASFGNGFRMLEPNEGDPADGSKWEAEKLKGFHGGIPRASGNLVVFTRRINRTASLYDFSNPAKPKFLTAWKLSGNPDIAAFHDGKVVIPCGYQGILLQK